MKVRLYRDETTTLKLEDIAANLNRLASSFSFSVGKAKFAIPGFFVVCPQAYGKLNPRIDKESADDDEVILFTEKPYDNNYFWDAADEDEKVVVSLSGWDHLTSLPRNNGAVYFVCAMLIRDLDVGFSHRDKDTGCINDFWMDKTGVDAGMRCAFVCERCLQSFKRRATDEQMALLRGVQAILDDLSQASRASMDICDFWAVQSNDESFDVFMCHNNHEKEAIRQMNRRLQKSGITTWLDEEQLPPGRLWQELLEEQIESIKTAAVFVGNSGIGPWQNIEIRAFLQEFAHRRCPVIPVILSDCKSPPVLPLFLRQVMWVDFRKAKPDPYKNLLWGITGKRP